MVDGLYRVTYKGICAGFIVEDGVITRCAPILRKKISFFKLLGVLVKNSTSGVSKKNLIE